MGLEVLAVVSPRVVEQRVYAARLPSLQLWVYGEYMGVWVCGGVGVCRGV